MLLKRQVFQVIMLFMRLFVHDIVSSVTYAMVAIFRGKSNMIYMWRLNRIRKELPLCTSEDGTMRLERIPKI